MWLWSMLRVLEHQCLVQRVGSAARICSTLLIVTAVWHQPGHTRRSSSLVSPRGQSQPWGRRARRPCQPHHLAIHFRQLPTGPLARRASNCRGTLTKFRVALALGGTLKLACTPQHTRTKSSKLVVQRRKSCVWLSIQSALVVGPSAVHSSNSGASTSVRLPGRRRAQRDMRLPATKCRHARSYGACSACAA